MPDQDRWTDQRAPLDRGTGPFSIPPERRSRGGCIGKPRQVSRLTGRAVARPSGWGARGWLAAATKTATIAGTAHPNCDFGDHWSPDGLTLLISCGVVE